ncbi:expansin-A26-like [Solanum dulcamara]|uniref:expansin-A26-like n=1 Tax=Solanum dulcamara TaxID=45834 RepID=UPI0024856C96|nr:expansin-A26-like [Solanum dulcamara]
MSYLLQQMWYLLQQIVTNDLPIATDTTSVATNRTSIATDVVISGGYGGKEGVDVGGNNEDGGGDGNGGGEGGGNSGDGGGSGDGGIGESDGEGGRRRRIDGGGGGDDDDRRKENGVGRREGGDYLAIGWISFPSLPPNFFGKESVFSLAAAVGKSLQVDLATRNQTRPSYARVKVESEFPKRINVGLRKQSGEICYKWLYPKREKMGEDLMKEKMGNQMGDNTRKLLQDKKGDNQRKEEQFREYKNKKGYGKRRYQAWEKPEQVWNKKQKHQNSEVVERQEINLRL